MTYSIETAAGFNTKSDATSRIVETVGEHIIAQAEFDAHIEALSSDIAPEIEIDSQGRLRQGHTLPRLAHKQIDWYLLPSCHRW